jgi:cytochrome P450
VRGAGQPAAAVTLAGLDGDPHPLLASMRAAGPVCWVPALGAWLVTGYQCALDVLRDARTFTVDDPRFSTAKVVGPSMLSLDGAQHARHRAPFSRAFRSEEVHARLASFTQAEAGRLVTAIAPRGEAELRRAVAGPLAAAVMAKALGLENADPAQILTWYDGIVAAVQAEAARQAVAAVHADGAGSPPRAHSPAAGPAHPADSTGRAGTAAFAELAASLREVIAAARHQSLLAEAVAGPEAGTEPDAGPPLTGDEAISNAAVLMFGGIETTEGMIANAALHLLTHPGELGLVRADPGLVPAAIEESLRLEPAAAVVDRYATADALLGGVRIPAGEQVTVSIAAANRDPAVFADPDRYDVRRANASRHLAFAHGPHFCLGAHLARLEARIAIETLLDQLPQLCLDDRFPAEPRGLVFRKPPDLRVRWNPGEGNRA